MRGPLTLPKHEAALPASEASGADPRLIDFVRALARQAAREAREAQNTDTASEAPPS